MARCGVSQTRHRAEIHVDVAMRQAGGEDAYAPSEIETPGVVDVVV